MDSYQRHKLKEDKFTTAVTSGTHWAAENRTMVIIAALLVVVAALAVFGFSYRQNNREHEASEQLGKAVRTYSAPILQGGEKPTPGTESYATTKERVIASNKAFEAVANSYPHTDAGRNALYMSGVTAAELGDNAKAETDLKSAADHASADVSALAKLSLANLYHATNRDNDAIRMLQELRTKPTNTVSSTAAALQLASIYETTDPKQAIAIYDEVQKSDKSEGGTIAQERRTSLNGKTSNK